MSKKKKSKQTADESTKNLIQRIEKDQTGAQVYGAATYGYYINSPDPREVISPRKISAMERFPTIVYMIQLITIAGESSEWTVECDEGVPFELVNLIQRIIDKTKFDLWRTAIYDWICYGHAAYEKQYEVLENEDGHYRLSLKGFKHLLPETYLIERDAEIGFLGIRTVAPRSAFLNPDKCLVLTNDQRGDDMNGRSLLKNAERTFDAIHQTWENMQLYSRKASNGPKYKIHFPDKTIVDENGRRTRCFDKALEMADSLEDKGVVLLPHPPQRAANQMVANSSDWDIERFPNESVSGNFINELMYMDKCLCRAFGIPERSVLEGMFSTRADAGNATEFTLMRIMFLVRDMVNQINKHVVNPIVQLNYDDMVDRIRIVAGNIDRSSVEAVRQFAMQMITSDPNMLNEVDKDVLMDISRLPRLQKTEEKEKLVRNEYYTPSEPYDRQMTKHFSWETNYPNAALKQYTSSDIDRSEEVEN